MHPKDNQLREIIIEGEKPLLKMEGNKLIYDITQLTNTKLVTNAYEVIRNLPGIMEYNGTLTLAGSDSVNILLNDKVSSMTYEQILTLLKSCQPHEWRKSKSCTPLPHNTMFVVHP